VRASTIRREQSQLVFTVNWLRWWVTDWNLLTGIRSGSIGVAVSDGMLAVRFSLKSFDFLVFALMAGLAIVLLIPRGGAMEAAIIWTSIGAVSYLVRWLRFRWFVQRCVGDAFDEWVTMAKTA
jgi:hypothetical protein